MKTIIITPASSEPVTLSELKEQLRIESDFTIDDNLINDYNAAARTRCESYCNNFFTVQDIAIIDTATEENCLPYPNLGITSVEVDDTVTTDYTYDSDLQVLTLGTTGTKLKVYATTAQPSEFEGVKQAVKMIVTDLYELRTESVLNVSVSENPAVKALLYPYRLSLSI